MEDKDKLFNEVIKAAKQGKFKNQENREASTTRKIAAKYGVTPRTIRKARAGSVAASLRIVEAAGEGVQVELGKSIAPVILQGNGEREIRFRPLWDKDYKYWEKFRLGERQT